MATSDIEIQVRTISGDSTTLWVSVNSSVEDLKLLLKQTFPPAHRSPNFHLFYKGVKLKLQRKVGTLDMGNSEFLVLVPFAKRDSNQTQNSSQPKASMKVPNQPSISKFAESAWSDMMHDLSYLSDDPVAKAPEFEIAGNLRNRRDASAGLANSWSSEAKRKRGSIECDDLLYDILWAPKSMDVLDEYKCEKFIEFLNLVNCLSDLHSGNCMLSIRSCSQAFGIGLPTNDGSTCLCPTWLKILLKAFAFLNVFSAFLQLQQARTTLNLLEEALDQLGKFGVKLCIRDLEHLSIISPKVVSFANNAILERSHVDALVIIKRPTEYQEQVKYKHKSVSRQMNVAEIVCALKRRENSFKSDLWKAVEQLMFITGNEKATFSLEGLLLSLKDRVTAASSNNRRKAKGSNGTSSSYSGPKRCNATNELRPVEMVDHLRKGVGSKIVHVEDIDARKANYTEIPKEISQNMISALKDFGVSKLYSHQAESIQASLAGKNVVVATMTSSGKSLCYNLPVLELLSQNLLACALYLFPTKALAQDQLRALLVLKKELDGSLNIGVYDGDTPKEERKWLRDNVRLLITNPDMLHMSILPHHKQFERILSNLRFVVVDEAHAYKGAFGCHTALILRRLRRLCSHVYGSDPSFVFSTATSANPLEHCKELANLPKAELIENDGSPSARKLFILWNPVLHQETVSNETNSTMCTTKSAEGIAKVKKSSPILDVSRLFAEMVQHGLRCIAFCRSRKLCELVLCYTREILEETAPHLIDSICAYRAGYIAEYLCVEQRRGEGKFNLIQFITKDRDDRRSIERDFFSGKLCGIAATNALELGIDVGHIDVTLHLGFPGSIASLWQQAGRAGRRETPSLAVYVAFDGPLDQHFMKFPRKLFGSPIECCHIDAQNKQVIEQHLVCAAYEHPLSLLYDEKYFGFGLSTAIMSLKNSGYLSSDTSSDSPSKLWNYIGHAKLPSHSVSIRAIETEKYRVVDKQRNEILEEIEESKAFFQVYEGAVYIRQGKTYLVESLEFSSKIAFCVEADLKYYTRPRDCTDIHVISGHIAYPTRVGTAARADPCKVTTSWFGFHRVERGSNQIIETVDLTLPNFSYTSQAVWVPVPQSTKLAVTMNNLDFRAGLHAASHAVLNVVPLRIICDSLDLAPECPNPHDTRYYPERILLYDQHPGGMGVSMQVQPFFMELLAAALELLSFCCCSGNTGCPNCIQNFACHEYNEVLHKDAAIMIIKGVLDAEEQRSKGAMAD
ncbi:uncharacterized protein LOC107433954 isoform X2 [Ziziphus jujuba]|uniref:Uncharacterized protein LOC107433954 isoform X2 n=1 Tax=Ziziphus jujuba TaxID=326968 RepID=A0ABM4ABW4_ZIZJJ|nr:uncharacterized protein LOC107433954 isoform X2 [Ziziphus jujuba]